jgi:hypothetical protein
VRTGQHEDSAASYERAVARQVTSPGLFSCLTRWICQLDSVVEVHRSASELQPVDRLVTLAPFILPSARVWLETAPVLSAALLCPSAALITAKTPKINTYHCPVLLPCPAHAACTRRLPTPSPTLATRQFHRPRSAALRLSDLPRDASRVVRCCPHHPVPSTAYQPSRRATAPRTASSPRPSHHGPDSCAHIAQSHQPAGERPCSQSSGLHRRE